jgi:hypothetical protein
MRQRTTLQSRIIALWCRQWPYDEIVEEIGCRREYVRAVISRARYGGKTPGDITQDTLRADAGYRAARNELLRERYQTDLKYRERVKAATRACYARRSAELRAQNDGAPARGEPGR